LKICITVGSRANYASIKSVISAIHSAPEFELSLVCYGSAIESKHGNVSLTIEEDGFHVDYRLHTSLQSDSLGAMAESAGNALSRLPTVFESLDPDLVFVVGDRYEVLAASMAAAYMNIPIAHTMGGEVTGTLDESVRHAITKLSHLHFVSTNRSKDFVIRMGEDPRSVFLTGCPRLDLVRLAPKMSLNTLNSKIMDYGSGDLIDIEHPFVLLMQHPVTTELFDINDQIINTLEAVNEVGLPILALWPNADAGSEAISKELRRWLTNKREVAVRIFRNLPPEIYLKLMSQTNCLVGNSSSGIREGSFIGVPVVNIGTRQNCREKSFNVVEVGTEQREIKDAVIRQLQHGKYTSSQLYGDGFAAERIVKVLSSRPTLKVQKTLNYLSEI